MRYSRTSSRPIRAALPFPFLFGGLLLAGTLGLAACATSGTTPRSNPNLLTYEEIQSIEAADLFEVVQRLRPRWLEDRSARTTLGTTAILVYQEQARLGDVSILRQLPVSAAGSMRFLDAAQASATLPGIGSGHVAGAIVISSRRDQVRL